MEAEMEPSSSKKSKSASPMPSPLNLQAKKTGVTLFWQQFRALMKKNYLLALRSKRSTVLQVGSSLFFIFLIFAVDQALQAQRKSTTAFQNVFDPEAVPVTAIPRCEDGFFIKSPCYDFLWTPTGNPKIAQIVEGIRNRNPGRPIPPEKVLGFSNSDEVDQWLLDNPMRCIGALHFEENVPNVISYGLQTNSTVKNKRGIFEDAVFKFMIPFQMAAEREIVRFVTNDANIDWSVSFKEFAHPAFTVFSTVGTVGPIFLLAAAMFGFVIQISNLVSERELKLRQAMSIMGLVDSAYWCSWLIWEVFIALLSSILLVLFGMMFQFDFFLNNSFGVLFFMFFLFQFNMIGFAFMISAFVSKATSARTVGFVIYVFGFVTQLVTNFGFPYDSSFAKYLQVIWSIFPPNLLAVGLNYLGKATATKQDEGISWVARDRCSAADENCVLTMEDIFIWLTGLFFAWFLLAIYFDNVFADQNGVRKSCFYFLQPSYWTGRATSQVEGGGLCSCTRSLQPPPDSTPVDEDVAEEEDLVKRQIIDRDSVDSNIAVQMCGLVKTFPGVTKITGCCRCRSTDPYYAVKGLWLNIERNKLFCLLGPNGAGKTTTINCLTGILPTTGGDAIVYGESIRNAAGLSNIRSFMGVCPQFDILWSALTGLEHLKLFANIKGLSSTQISTNAEELLSHVKLNDDKNIRAGSYSGGMKRRLSVAIALIGDPKIVYLDEPTTGMDPVTRRHVWDIIESAKKGRAIILTTHSMEEADILGDRIAIMAKGKLRCIGTSIRLKSKFGSGYIVTVSLKKVKSTDNLQHSDEGTSQRDLVLQFFKEKLEVDPKEENKAYISFVIPRNKEHLLVNFFTELQEREDELGISDIQVSLTTLEEVFLNIAKQAELETAAAEGRFETVILADGTTIRVPVGAQFVALPGTENAEHVHGMMMELYWQQDESGNLCLSGQSEPMPAPSPLLAAGSGRSGDVPIVVSRSGRFGSRRESIPIAWAVEQPQLAPHGNDSSVSRS